MKKTRKGFTIVELIIVIAVIAVLTAILVPTFIHLTKKANEAADHSLVTNLNKALAMREAEEGEKGKNSTMYDCVVDLKKEGYALTQLVTRSDEDLVWSQKTNRFFLSSEYEGAEKQGEMYNCWHIYKQMPSEQTWAIYASEEWSEATVTNLKVGFDAGDAEVTNVTYKGDAGYKVVIRTNSANTTLTIDAKDDTVSHHGSAGRVIIDKIDLEECFNEFGKAAYVKLSQGKVIAKQGGEIKVLFATNADASKVAVINDNGTIESAYTTTEAISTANQARPGGIALTYEVDSQPVTESMVNGYAEAAIEENLIEEIETSGLYEARIGTTGYTNFVEATAAISAGETLVLCKDIVRSESESVALWDKPFNVDLNGHTYEARSIVDVSLSNMGYKASAFCFAYNGNHQVTVKNGTIKTRYGAPVYAASNTVLLENVTLFQDHENYHQPTEEYSSAVRTTGGSAIFNSGSFEGYYALTVSNSGGNFTVNGGTFKGPLFFSASFSKNVTKADKVMTINGGTFINFSVINGDKGTLTIRGGSFDHDPSAYVASGYHATENAGVWTVSAN